MPDLMPTKTPPVQELRELSRLIQRAPGFAEALAALRIEIEAEPAHEVPPAPAARRSRRASLGLE
jgi:hypothetical protein